MTDFTQDIPLMFQDFGESVTLQYMTQSLPVNALVDSHSESVAPLMSGSANFSFALTMAATDAAILTPEWAVLVRNEIREVLECVDQGNGLTVVFLGDPQ